jgi:hypothetical protein
MDDTAVMSGNDRILSPYDLNSGGQIWILPEADPVL